MLHRDHNTNVKYQFNLPSLNGKVLTVPLDEGKAVFVLGANGVGKSALMHSLFQQNLDHSKRILAHRQSSFHSDSVLITAAQRRNIEYNIKNSDNEAHSRFRDDRSHERLSISIFDLVNSQNVRARGIADAVDLGDLPSAQNLSKIPPPLQTINELFSISNIPIKITLERDEQLLASKHGSQLYSISELSDGERNALLICADVLTADPNCLIIIDEPERHLHRSIISPLLSSLFQKRSDCVFVISTHDVYLPLDHSDSSVLLLRGCKWNGKQVQSWVADLILESSTISNEVKKDILGAKRNILFVEGDSGSLDKQIYQLVFPDTTVIPQGNCTQVEKAVEGIKKTDDLHWINAFGLIDADDRTAEQIRALLEKGIVALKCYSVEALYYRLEIVKKIAERHSKTIGEDKEELYKKAISKISENICQHKERMCSRVCEKRVRNQIVTALPTHEDIIEKIVFEKKIDLNSFMNEEELLFEKLVTENDLNGLISRYPVRETSVLNGIAKGLGFKRDMYESAVRKLIIDDAETQSFYRGLLSDLTNLISSSRY